MYGNDIQNRSNPYNTHFENARARNTRTFEALRKQDIYFGGRDDQGAEAYPDQLALFITTNGIGEQEILAVIPITL